MPATRMNVQIPENGNMRSARPLIVRRWTPLFDLEQLKLLNTKHMMQRWLQVFAYRTTLDLWIFGLSGLLAVLVAYLAVFYHALKAATANPVETLKYE